ncbi:MAG TPA: DUF6285 domain-containing protein [Byssovorax sp.]|jgi:hypothetical protein
MQNRPEKQALLEAVARFLATDVKAAVKDPSVAFRVLVAANLCAVVAAEVATEEMQEHAELERLVALGLAEDKPRAASADRKRAIADANREIVRRARAGELDEDATRRLTEHALITMRGELLAQSPRFDQAMEIEP